MSNHARPNLTTGASRKRKDRDGGSDAPGAPTTTKAEPTAASAPANNRLLAGYFAHEFLTKGTLLGQRFDPARCEPDKNSNQTRPVGQGKSPNEYDDVAYLLKTDGAHIPGVFNPTQLARWLQIPLAPARGTTPLE